jgi:NAD(P)-dependent dehydrogenase (short-subunit alcohol dehydrogenase family)
MRLSGKTAIVTGAGGNLGRAVARRLAAEGASVAVFDRNQVRGAALIAKLAGDHIAVPVDLMDPASVENGVRSVTDEFGGIDILCAAAGGFDMGPPVHETPAEVWTKMHDLNVGTLLPILAAVTPGMIERGRGRIVTVGANAAKSGVAGMGPYIAAKSAVMRITECASAELKDQGINVNCVLPSIIDTPENRAAMPKADPAKWVTPESLAGVVAFLSSDEAADIHGVLLQATGKV